MGFWIILILAALYVTGKTVNKTRRDRRIGGSFIMQPGERMIIETDNVRYYQMRTRQERRSYNVGTSQRTSKRTVQHINMGKARSHDYSTVTKYGPGIFCLTNKNIYFASRTYSVTIPIKNIAMANDFGKGFEVIKNTATSQTAGFEFEGISRSKEAVEAIKQIIGGTPSSKPHTNNVGNISKNDAVEIVNSNRSNERGAEMKSGTKKSKEIMEACARDLVIGKEYSTREATKVLTGSANSNRDPSDFSYNMTNKGIENYAGSLHLFEQTRRGFHIYLGENYPYNGKVTNKYGEIVGHWQNGIFEYK
jgi:hypothetical protein